MQFECLPDVHARALHKLCTGRACSKESMPISTMSLAAETLQPTIAVDSSHLSLSLLSEVASLVTLTSKLPDPVSCRLVSKQQAEMMAWCSMSVYICYHPLQERSIQSLTASYMSSRTTESVKQHQLPVLWDVWGAQTWGTSNHPPPPQAPLPTPPTSTPPPPVPPPPPASFPPKDGVNSGTTRKMIKHCVAHTST